MIDYFPFRKNSKPQGEDRFDIYNDDGLVKPKAKYQGDVNIVNVLKLNLNLVALRATIRDPSHVTLYIICVTFKMLSKYKIRERIPEILMIHQLLYMCHAYLFTFIHHEMAESGLLIYYAQQFFFKWWCRPIERFLSLAKTCSNVNTKRVAYQDKSTALGICVKQFYQFNGTAEMTNCVIIHLLISLNFYQTSQYLYSINSASEGRQASDNKKSMKN